MPQNRIIAPVTSYDLEIKILFDPRTGNTEMQIRNKGITAVSMLQVAGIIANHQSALINQLITGGLKAVNVPQDKPDTPPQPKESGNA